MSHMATIVAAIVAVYSHSTDLCGRNSQPSRSATPARGKTDDVADVSGEDDRVTTDEAGDGPAPACVVVGGSLVGMSAATVLSRLGFAVTVLERSPARGWTGGGGLGVDVALLREVTGIDDAPPVVHGSDRDTTAWHLLQGWLEDHALALGVTVRRGTEVTAVRPGAGRAAAGAASADGDEYSADLVIVADGARSENRASVVPHDPGARYAGVLLWRALVDEQALPDEVARLRSGEPSREVYAGPYRLVTYLVPGAEGQAAVGRRRLNLVWYDPEQGDLLRGLGLLAGETVHASLAPQDVPGPIRERLAAFAAANWPMISGRSGLPKFMLSVSASGRAPTAVRLRQASATAWAPPVSGSARQ